MNKVIYNDKTIDAYQNELQDLTDCINQFIGSKLNVRTHEEMVAHYIYMFKNITPPVIFGDRPLKVKIAETPDRGSILAEIQASKNDSYILYLEIVIQVKYFPWLPDFRFNNRKLVKSFSFNNLRWVAKVSIPSWAKVLDIQVRPNYDVDI